MNQINMSALKKLSAQEVLERTPAVVLYDGEPVFVMGGMDDIIIVSDLHPAVRNRLLAMERLARVGMPKAPKVDLAEVVAARPPEPEPIAPMYEGEKPIDILEKNLYPDKGG